MLNVFVCPTVDAGSPKAYDSVTDVQQCRSAPLTYVRKRASSNAEDVYFLSGIYLKPCTIGVPQRKRRGTPSKFHRKYKQTISGITETQAIVDLTGEK